MRIIKKSMAYALVAAMIVTLAPANNAGAAKKVKLNRKTATVFVGKTVKIKVQNAKKTAKVTWKSSKAKVAKIKKSTKKGNASATIAGVKEGKSTITATIKTGKKKSSVKCNVTVKKDVTVPAASQGPVVVPSAQPAVSTQPTATVQPTQDVPKTTPTKRPSPTPKPSPTPSPTPMPVDEFEFEAVKNGIPIDVSTYEKIGGNGSYNKDTKRVEINDTSAADVSQGTWVLPETVPVIQEGDIVTFRVQGYNYGNSGFRFWIGSGISGGCTPVQLSNEIDEELKIGEVGYPVAVEGEDGGQPKYLNQMQLVVDEKTKAFDVTFSFKAGTSQNDTQGVYPNLTLKYIMSGGTSGYIDGLCIENIYYITDEDQTPPTDDPSNTDKPSNTDAPAVVKKVDFSTSQQSQYYNADENKLVFNDSEGSTELYLNLPEAIAAGKEVKFTVKGTYTGDTGFRLWIGNGPNNKAEAVKVFPADFKQGEFEETFTMKAQEACEYITIKGVPSWDGGKGYIAGLEINEIAIAYPEES